ncbi:MAG: hypothetical protein KA821_02790 [Chitinophagaceae bacterium]|nr:hypothetical protein [Chitinophagaceae bacterium]
MRILAFLLLICSNAVSQQITVLKLQEQSTGNNTLENTYGVRIYNNTDKPICIPISNSFAYRMNINDTLELGDIYSEKDSVVVVSLFWSKKDLEIDPQQMPSYPIILNPRTYLLTNIKFVKPLNTKEIFFEFKHSFGPNLDYQRISALYNSEPKFIWKKSLKFIETRVGLEL